MPIFATPLGIAAVPGAAALNPGVATLLAERATPARADASRQQPFASEAEMIFWTGPRSRSANSPAASWRRCWAWRAPSTILATNSLQDSGYGPSLVRDRALERLRAFAEPSERGLVRHLLRGRPRPP